MVTHVTSMYATRPGFWVQILLVDSDVILVVVDKLTDVGAVELIAPVEEVAVAGVAELSLGGTLDVVDDVVELVITDSFGTFVLKVESGSVDELGLVWVALVTSGCCLGCASSQ